MKPEEMAAEAIDALKEGTLMTLVLPKCFKRPPKFPRGELICENIGGDRVYRFDPMRLLAWLAANGFVKVIATASTTARKP